MSDDTGMRFSERLGYRQFRTGPLNRRMIRVIIRFAPFISAALPDGLRRIFSKTCICLRHQAHQKA
jgi:hypothetical protein